MAHIALILAALGTIATASASVAQEQALPVNSIADGVFVHTGQTAQMTRENAGAIANVGTMVAYGGSPFLLGYSASKGALMTLTRGLANALRRDRIRINTLNIGWTNTPREHVVQTQVHHRPENWLAEVSPNLPFGRLIEADEVARALAFLTSAESGLMTGAVIDFDQQIIGTMPDQPEV